MTAERGIGFRAVLVTPVVAAAIAISLVVSIARAAGKPPVVEKSGSVRIPRGVVTPPSRRLSGRHHPRRSEGEDALGTAGKDASATLDGTGAR